MGKSHGRRFLYAILFGLCFYGSSLYAAKQIDLSHQDISILHSIAPDGIGFKEVGTNVDFRKTTHTRLKETYLGHPVWGGDVIVHLPEGRAKSLADIMTATKGSKATLDGTLYQDISKDLVNTPAYVFNQAQSQKALETAISDYQHNAGTQSAIKDQESKLIVYVDDQNKAHWAFQVSFYVQPVKDGVMPAKPVYLMDAVTFHVYAKWDDIKTLTELISIDATNGGGFGGNQKMGKLIYDGLSEHLANLSIQRDTDTKVCYLQNSEVVVKHYRGGSVASFNCDQIDETHNRLYWDAEFHAVNGGYSPDNDALFGGAIIKNMYQKWYGVPVLSDHGEPMLLIMVVHDPIDNAYWDGKKMTFGDGVRIFYPLTSLGVAAHEISHGFTQQHSDLTYFGQSGGMNEAFSDMAAQAAELYAFGKNSWQIGPEIFKAENEALRYMDQPSKDCKGKEPGDWCSIDTAGQYYAGLDVHFSSGVYNHFFYLLGTTKGWNAKKAFDVMVHANMSYWTASTNFARGACGVIKAAKDLGYDVSAVKKAFKAVEINTSNC